MSTKLFGLAFRSDEALSMIDDLLHSQRTAAVSIVTINVDHVVTLLFNKRFRATYSDASLRTLDGTPLVWLAKARMRGRPARITGHDLLSAAISEKFVTKRKYFIVAPSELVGSKVRSKLIGAGAICSNVEIYIPPFGFEKSEIQSHKLASAMRSHDADFVIMGVGAPKSEIWIHAHRNLIGTPVVLNVGEAVAVASGTVSRAPLLVQKLGFEWLFRFAKDPKRLFIRYFVKSFLFIPAAILDPDLSADRNSASNVM